MERSDYLKLCDAILKRASKTTQRFELKENKRININKLIQIYCDISEDKSNRIFKVVGDARKDGATETEVFKTVLTFIANFVFYGN